MAEWAEKAREKAERRFDRKCREIESGLFSLIASLYRQGEITKERAQELASTVDDLRGYRRGKVSRS